MDLDEILNSPLLPCRCCKEKKFIVDLRKLTSVFDYGYPLVGYETEGVKDPVIIKGHVFEKCDLIYKKMHGDNNESS
jgi:hypothetical protein